MSIKNDYQANEQLSHTDWNLAATAIKEELPLKAPKDSPTFTGNPSAPTPVESTNTTQLATTAFVQLVVSAAINGLINSAPSTLNTLKEIADQLAIDESASAAILAQVVALQNGKVNVAGFVDAVKAASPKNNFDDTIFGLQDNSEGGKNITLLPSFIAGLSGGTVVINQGTSSGSSNGGIAPLVSTDDVPLHAISAAGAGFTLNGTWLPLVVNSVIDQSRISLRNNNWQIASGYVHPVHPTSFDAYFRVDFLLHGNEFEFKVLGKTASYRIRVNGVPLSATLDKTLPNDSQSYYHKITFPTVGLRYVELEGIGDFQIFEFRTGAKSAIYKSFKHTRWRHVRFTDSMGAGTFGSERFVPPGGHMQDYAGNEIEVLTDGIGGTGIKKPGNNAFDRLAAVLALNPDSMSVEFGINDSGYQIAEYQPDVENLIIQIRAARPTMPLIFVEPWSTWGGYDQDLSRARTAIRQAITEQNKPANGSKNVKIMDTSDMVSGSSFSDPQATGTASFSLRNKDIHWLPPTSPTDIISGIQYAAYRAYIDFAALVPELRPALRPKMIPRLPLYIGTASTGSTGGTTGGGGTTTNTTPASPTGGTVDDTNNAFDWIHPSGFTTADEETTIDGGNTAIAAVKPLQVGDIAKAAGQVGVRVKAATGRNASPWLFNATPFAVASTGGGGGGTPTPATGDSIVTSMTDGPMRNDFSGEVGIEVTPLTAGRSLTAVGAKKYAGNTGTRTIRIRHTRLNFELVGTATIDFTGVADGAVAWATLSSPIPMEINDAYDILREETAGGQNWSNIGAVTVNSNFSCQGSRYYTPTGSGVEQPNTEYAGINAKFS